MARVVLFVSNSANVLLFRLDFQRTLRRNYRRIRVELVVHVRRVLHPSEDLPRSSSPR